MALAPGVVVVIVDRIEHLPADNGAHTLDHPFAPGIGVFARERHARDVLLPEIRILMQKGRRHVDAVLAARRLDEGGGGLVTEAARTEMHTDPDQTFLVLEQIDVVVAGTDGAELVARHALEVLDRLDFLPERAVEQRVIDLFRIAAAKPETDVGGDLVEDRPDAVRDALLGHVELHRHVAASDVETDARHRDVLFICNDATNRLRIAEMAVRAQHAADHAAELHAAGHLRLGAIVVIAENLHLRHSVRAPRGDGRRSGRHRTDDGGQFAAFCFGDSGPLLN